MTPSAGNSAAVATSDTSNVPAAGAAEKVPDAPPLQFLEQVSRCGPAQWTTINCHACGSHVGHGFNANCQCGRCPHPPMVPVRCPCRGRGIVNSIGRPLGPVLDVCATANPVREPQPVVRAKRGVEVPQAVGSDEAHLHIGAAGRLAPALDVSVLYRERNFPALAAQFEDNGYLAFSNFLPAPISQGRRNVFCPSQVSKSRPGIGRPI